MFQTILVMFYKLKLVKILVLTNPKAHMIVVFQTIERYKVNR